MIDLRQTVSLTGLPNNSNLSIRPITKSRDQTVTVCVQLDNGERQVGEFRNDQSLWEIIGTLFPERVLDADNLEISCLYMRTEVRLKVETWRIKFTVSVDFVDRLC